MDDKIFKLYSGFILKLWYEQKHAEKEICFIFGCCFLVCSIFFSVYLTSNSNNQIYWGAWVGENDRMPLSTIQAFENQVGKGMSIWNWMQWWTGPTDQVQDPNFNSTWMDECRNAGMIPMISWGPFFHLYCRSVSGV